MNKDEILEKSKKENKIADPYEMEVANKGNRYGMAAGYTLCSVLILIHILQGQGLDYELYLIVFTSNAVSNVYHAVKLKNKQHIYMAIGTVAVLIGWIVLMILKAVKK